MQGECEIQEVEELILQWGMPKEVIANFKGNLIDIASMKMLSVHREMVRELIPPIGLRLKFEKMLANWMQAQEEAEMTTETEASSFGNDEAREDLSEINQEVPNPNNDSAFFDTNNVCIKLANNTTGLPDQTMFVLKEALPDFDLKTLLMTTCLGKSVLKYYETYQKLDKCHQQRLVKIMVGHIYNYIVKNRLENGDYNKLVAKIISLFPNEIVGVYYVPAVEKPQSPFGVSEKRRGKLPNVVRNIIFLSGGTKKRKRSELEEENIPPQKDQNITKDAKLLEQFDSTQVAFDTLFKLFHTFNAQYPPESEHLYLIIQRAVYKFTTQFDKTIPSILEFF